METDKLYVVTVISNPQMFKRRYELYYQFKEKMIENKQIILYTVELAYKQRNFVVTVNNNCSKCNNQNKIGFCEHCRTLRVRSNSELWHKENLINKGVEYLPEDWNYVAWIDADIFFANENWASDTIQALQHYCIVQIFQTAIDLGPDDSVLNIFQGFAYKYRNSNFDFSDKNYFTYHPGFCFACTKFAWDSMGGLPDYCILGSQDRHACYSWVGKVGASLDKNLNGEYKNKLFAFQSRCDKTIKRNIGYVVGCILHKWHGKKCDRQYNSRWQILIQNDYNPTTDIKYNWQGILEFTGNKPKLIYDINKYFKKRNEDSIDL